MVVSATPCPKHKRTKEQTSHLQLFWKPKKFARSAWSAKRCTYSQYRLYIVRMKLEMIFEGDHWMFIGKVP
jgi:hypothetical protein